jgi:hypothetical protein
LFETIVLNLKNKMNDDRDKYSYRDYLLNMTRDDKPYWISVDVNNSRPPDDYTVTNVNQTHDFLVSVKFLFRSLKVIQDFCIFRK